MKLNKIIVGVIACAFVCSFLVTTPMNVISGGNEAVGRLSWSDNFDSYTLGQVLDGTADDGGWKGWNNLHANGAPVSGNQSHSAPYSVRIKDPSDLVHQFSGYTTGKWIFTAWQYIPTGFSGGHYFILLNTYVDNGTDSWSTQVEFNSAGFVQSEGATTPNPQLSLILNQWVPIRVMIDLDTDNQKIYYNNQLLDNKVWTTGVSSSGVLNIAAVDLWSNYSSIVYYDDLSLQPNAFSLTTIIDGSGSVTKNPDQATYTYGTLVQLTAIPSANWTFDHWSGDLTGNANPATINMTGNKTVTAHFTPLTSSVTLNLYMGWNLITVPVEKTWTAESLGDAITGCSVVLMFNATTQTFLTHVVNTPYDNFPILDGVGYFIYTTSASSLMVTGLPITGVTVPISVGWDILGWYHEYNTTAESLGDAITGCSVVLKFDATTQAFTTHVVNTPYDNFAVTRGMGLWLYTTSASVWHGEG